MEQTELKQIIEELDRAIPKEGAQVSLTKYGGDLDECMVTGTERGYLRLGVELMKAAIAPSSNDIKNPHAVDVDTDYVITDDSDVQFDWFERRDDVQAKPYEHSWVDALLPFGCIAVMGATVVLAVIGFMTVIAWIIASTT